MNVGIYLVMEHGWFLEKSEAHQKNGDRYFYAVENPVVDHLVGW